MCMTLTDIDINMYSLSGITYKKRKKLKILNSIINLKIIFKE